MDKIVIGTFKSLAKGIEKRMPKKYTKEVNKDLVHFTFEMEDWDHPYDPYPAELMEYLFNEVGVNNYGFIRLGEEESEIHGTIESFEMALERKVLVYGE